MKEINSGKQIKDVWALPAIAKWKKSCGKHPTQKPLSVLTRLILASTKQGTWLSDLFTGSSTTGIAANLLKRKFLGIDVEEEFLKISKMRKLEIENKIIFDKYRNKLKVFKESKQLELHLLNEPKVEYKTGIKFSA